jgi:hypothetical protein
MVKGERGVRKRAGARAHGMLAGWLAGRMVRMEERLLATGRW